MNPKPKTSDEILIEHALETLPDSITRRKTLLNAVACKISQTHPDFKRVALMLLYLDKHEQQQAELPLTSAPAPVPAKPKSKRRKDRDGHNGDGDGKGDGK